MVEQSPTPADVQAAEARIAAFLAAVPAVTLAAEDNLPQAIRAMNASARSKLQTIYRLVDELALAREPFVPCAKGCASCCHMNVSLTQAEADRLGTAIGRRPAAVPRSIHHATDKFAGSPCPFLDDQHSCSVYRDRPLACRAHSSFLADAAPCHPSVMNRVNVPTVRFDGLETALFEVSGNTATAIVADIRDFFPAQTTQGHRLAAS